MAETRDDLPRMTSPGGLRLALNVRSQGIRTELLLGLVIIQVLCMEWGLRVVVTAILNGSHMKNSLHYTGSAVDFDFQGDVDLVEFLEELRVRLGRDFDVVDEGTHIHVEYQPPMGAVT